MATTVLHRIAPKSGQRIKAKARDAAMSRIRNGLSWRGGTLAGHGEPGEVDAIDSRISW
jgi:hypothetical protein